MRYALLICGDEADQSPELVGEFGKFMQGLHERGALVTAERLRPAETASTLRIREGNVIIADGPFAETKEQIGGIFVVDCADLDEALEIAALVPSASTGTVEVRPIWPM